VETIKRQTSAAYGCS